MTNVLNHIREIVYVPLEDHLPAVGEYVLLKTARVTAWDRWSILGWDPWLKWVPSGKGDVWGEFASLVPRPSPPEADGRPTSLGSVPNPYSPIPIPCLMGAIAYDAGRWIETIPATARAVMNLPDMVFYGFRRYLIADERERRMYAVTYDDSSPSPSKLGVGLRPSASSACKVFRSPPATVCLCTPPPLKGGEGEVRQWSSNFTRSTYAATVDQIRAMIAAGDCYQVNLSQQIQAQCPLSAEAIFRDAVAANPAPMMALVNAGDFQLISTSPERLVRRQGDELVSRPIKGTRARGSAPDEDAALKEALRSSVKDNAELAMIVDLIRNDLGRVAIPGSVVVQEPAVIESYTNVHHLLATIVARARADATWPAILLALFPGGSVTGCPKAQAMKVIEVCEEVRRGFYCGSIGYIAANGDGDWNIAIRTITKIGDQAIFNLGGAVTYDSDPHAEYEETLQKGLTLFHLLGP